MSDHRIAEAYMRRAVRLARQGRGSVEPNPMVGAVVVRDGRVIAEGWHKHFGGPHAEVTALREAGESARGADLYVTLSPCCRRGKTGPCTDVVLAAGLRRVVIGLEDPTQRESIPALRRAGLQVVVGCLAAECERLVGPFLKLRTRHRPYVTAKWAMTADGKIATHLRASRWITCEPARRMVHLFREQSDVVLVGIETVMADDPMLTCRLPNGKNPIRAVLDGKARLPLDSRLVRTLDQAPVWVFSRNAPKERVRRLRDAGCQVFDLSSQDASRGFDEALTSMAEAELTHVLIEGGARVLASAFESHSVDEARVFVAPKVLGGVDALTPVAGRGIADPAYAIRLIEPRWQPVGSDVMLAAYVDYSLTEGQS